MRTRKSKKEILACDTIDGKDLGEYLAPSLICNESPSSQGQELEKMILLPAQASYSDEDRKKAYKNLLNARLANERPRCGYPRILRTSI